MDQINQLIAKSLRKGTPEGNQFRRWLLKKGFFAKVNIDRYAYLRHDRIVKRYFRGLSEIENLESLAKRPCVEIGCGSGSASAAFSQIFGSVLGFDIDAKGIQIGRNRLNFYDLQNCDLIHIPNPEDLIDAAVNAIQENSVVVLYAVLEHMTERERFLLLRRIWEKMTASNLLVIGELPNRLLYFDEHTYLVPFIHMLPDYTFAEAAGYYDFRFKEKFDNIDVDEEFNVERSRRGLGMSFHEFEICFKATAQSFVVKELTHPKSENELFLLDFFSQNNLTLPDVFACQMMHFVAKKITN